MTRFPKFANHTKPRGYFATPIFKYWLAGGLTLTGLSYITAYYIFDLLIKEKLEKWENTYGIKEPKVSELENMILQHMIDRKLLQEQEDKHKKE